MPEGQLLEFSAVTKRFGAVTAVDSFSARVEPGRVTGFLGPNGAGKTTTLRILLGLVRATDGTATIGGVPYAKLSHPLRTVGAVLEASSFHPGRTAANHLKVYAQAAGLPTSRVDEALGLVGLGDVGGRKVGGYSLGMRQRLGLAYALLGDPGVLVLDEPANGLDPEGIKWMRGLLRDLARQGRTVLVSSHLLAEVQQTVDSLLILSAGKLVFEGALDDLADPSEYATVADCGRSRRPRPRPCMPRASSSTCSARVSRCAGSSRPRSAGSPPTPASPSRRSSAGGLRSKRSSSTSSTARACTRAPLSASGRFRMPAAPAAGAVRRRGCRRRRGGRPPTMRTRRMPPLEWRRARRGDDRAGADDGRGRGRDRRPPQSHDAAATATPQR